MEIYKKPALDYGKQLQQLKDRGLNIENEKKSLHLLENLSYYRLSAYLYPLLEKEKEKHIFKKGAKFDTAFKMYCFDRELRLLLLNNLEKIEIAFRAKLIYVLSHKYDAFWYTYKKLFKNDVFYNKSIENINKLQIDSTEDFVLKYRKKYLNNFLPSWMAMEIVTFTHLSKTYENLKDTSAKSEIAKHFGLPYQLLENWLLMLTYTRNICAHHSRFWNKEFSIKVLKTKKDLQFNWINQKEVARNKAYIYISIIKYIIDRINPNNCFNSKLTNLFEKYQNIDYIKSMGFPEDWEEQPLWINKEK